jgi:hypothetical protein
MWNLGDVIVMSNRPWRRYGPSHRRSGMNRFGRIAQQRWQTLAPSAYARIEDPNRHFSTLGEEAEKAWIDLADQLIGPDGPQETYWGKVGRINNARHRAQELIEADWLTPPTDLIEPDPEETGDQLDQESARRQAMWFAEDPERIQLSGASSLLEALQQQGITLQVLGWTPEELAQVEVEAATLL